LGRKIERAWCRKDTGKADAIFRFCEYGGEVFEKQIKKYMG